LQVAAVAGASAAIAIVELNNIPAAAIIIIFFI
jgi:hypothetical protein